MSTGYTPTTDDVREIWSADYLSPSLFDRWFAEEIRKAKADGWDELYATAYGDVDGQPDITDPNNPYHKED